MRSSFYLKQKERFAFASCHECLGFIAPLARIHPGIAKNNYNFVKGISLNSNKRQTIPTDNNEGFKIHNIRVNYRLGIYYLTRLQNLPKKRKNTFSLQNRYGRTKHLTGHNCGFKNIAVCVQPFLQIMMKTMSMMRRRMTMMRGR